MIISLLITRGTVINRYLVSIFIHVSYLFLALQNCSAIDNTSTITSTQLITDSETLVSSGQIFKLGFFSPPNTTNRYVGIWYTKFQVQTIVWVANRDNPIQDSSGTLGIANDGNLVIVDGRGDVLWTTNVSNIATRANNSVAELLDTGNLVLTLINDNTRRVVLWQSFDHPTDTLLPLMKLGGSKLTGKKQQLTSWKGESDPSRGVFSTELELVDGIPQIVVWSNGSKFRHWRSGPWNNIVFIGIPNMTNAYNDGFYLTKDDQDDSVYISFNYAAKNPMKRFIIDDSGVLLGLNWYEGTSEWIQTWTSQVNECDVYGKCGPFGSCNPLNSPVCSCLTGFKPLLEDEWNKGNWSGGCVRNTPLSCRNNFSSSNPNDGFLKLENVKVPDFAYWSESPTLVDCNRTCLRNCSCVAYSYDGGIGCMAWATDLVDIQEFNETGGSLYVRLALSDLDVNRKNKNPNRVLSHKNLRTIIIITVLVAALATIVCTYFLWMWFAKRRGNHKKNTKVAFDLDNVHGETPGSTMLGDNLKIFKFEELAMATNDFSTANMLGEGGFGQVYK
ncbi:hypothetical protein MKW94_004265, partial [Papaver nudicaule]|nr:hypothetical protein [Papaver nudicaule]